MGQGAGREASLGAVMTSAGIPARASLKHAALGGGIFKLGRAGGGKFDQSVVEERHPALKATQAIGHVVEALERVVHQNPVVSSRTTRSTEGRRFQARDRSAR